MRLLLATAALLSASGIAQPVDNREIALKNAPNDVFKRQNSASVIPTTDPLLASTTPIDVVDAAVETPTTTTTPLTTDADETTDAAIDTAVTTLPTSAAVDAAETAQTTDAEVGTAFISIDTVSPTGVSITATLFQAEALVTTAPVDPATAGTPTSGCVIATQTAGTITNAFATTTFYLSVSSSLYCNCASGLQAGIYTKYDPHGIQTLYCATATSYGTTGAISTVTPTATPGSALNPAWANVSCSDGGLDDDLSNAWGRWNASGADAAWNEAYSQWWDQKPTLAEGITFSRFLGNFFHTRMGLNCSQIGNVDCDVNINCGQWTSPNADVSSPAGYVIMNSMVNIHSMLDKFYSAVGAAVGSAAFQVDEFAYTFNPITGAILEQQQQKKVLNIVQMVLGIGFAPLFNSWLQRAPWFKSNPNFLGIGGDISNAVLGSSMGYVKDAMELLSPLPIQNQIKAYLGGVTDSLIKNTQTIATSIFDNPDTVYKLIQNGLVLEETSSASLPDISNALKKALFAHIFPLTLTLNANVGHPFIATDIGVARTSTPGCAGWNPPDGTGSTVQITADSGIDGTYNKETRYCDGDDAYWLLFGNMVVTKEAQGKDRGGTFYDFKLSAPPALNMLNGTSTAYGGLALTDIFANAITSWKTNGMQNTNTTLNIQDQIAITTLESGGLIGITGLVGLPVCSFKEASDTAQADPSNSKGSPYWPCPGVY